MSNKLIRGAGFDVLETRIVDNPLLKLENVTFAPHIGSLTREPLGNLANIILEEVKGYNGNPVNILEK